MATETLAPDALLVQTGLTGAITAIDEDPASPDGSWLTTSSNTATDARVSFPTPTGNPSGTQTFRVLVRKTAQSTNPTCVVEVWEGGVSRATVVASTVVSSTVGTVLSGTWDASVLGTPSGANVECRVVGTTGGGSPSSRASVEVGAIAWDVTYTAVGTTFAQGVSGGFAPAGALSRRVARALTAGLSFAGSLSGMKVVPPAIPALIARHIHTE